MEAGQRATSGQNMELTGQLIALPVILTNHKLSVKGGVCIVCISVLL